MPTFYREAVVGTRINIPDGNFARYEGESGDFKIIIDDSNGTYHYPPGGVAFLSMAEEDASKVRGTGLKTKSFLIFWDNYSLLILCTGGAGSDP